MDIVTDSSDLIRGIFTQENDISIDKKQSDQPTPKKKKFLNVSRTIKKDIIFNQSFKEMRPSEKAKVMEKLSYA
jgi:hypothetical protein